MPEIQVIEFLPTAQYILIGLLSPQRLDSVSNRWWALIYVCENIPSQLLTDYKNSIILPLSRLIAGKKKWRKCNLELFRDLW